ncbi:unnamed protein product [Sympodiomycopsis kandeliae]
MASTSRLTVMSSLSRNRLQSSLQSSVSVLRRSLPSTHRSIASSAPLSQSRPSPQSPPPPQENPRPSREPGGSHEKHRLFYREFYPPLFRCLVYGTLSYFTLHLIWQILDGQEQDFLRTEEKNVLQDGIKELREKAGDTVDKVKDLKEGIKDEVETEKKKSGAWWRFGL